MKQYNAFSPRASMGLVARLAEKWRIWTTATATVQIAQKTIHYTPLEKLRDGWLNILAGGHGTVEVNTRVRCDLALQRAFGRGGCAEQSTVSRTLSACGTETVAQLRQGLQALFRQRSQTCSHAYEQQDLLVDVDMSGLTCGKQAEGATKGYFAGQKNRRGRQVGRVVASQYGEVIEERLYVGTVQLEGSLQELICGMEQVLALAPEQRAHILVRVDSGGGRDADINWLLERGYRIVMYVRQWQRTRNLAQRVQLWTVDPNDARREWGRVEEPFRYVRPTQQVAVRSRKADGSWTYRVLVLNLSDAQLLRLAESPAPTPLSHAAWLATAVRAYDLRGGGVETSLRQSKQGVGLKHRNKKSFAAQEMLLLLAQLAYHLVLWVRLCLSQRQPDWQKWGVLRMVRDVFCISGRLHFDAQGDLAQICLNSKHPLAARLKAAYPPDGLGFVLRKI